MPAPTIPSSSTCWILASGYKDAGDATLALIRSGEYTGHALFPCIFSYFRSIELALKSVLVANAVPEQEITQKFSHSISKLMSRAERFVSLQQIGIDANARAILDRFSDDYSKKWYEYPSDLWQEHSELEVLQTLSRQICEATRQYETQMPF